MEGGHRGTNTEFSTDKAHAADAPWGSTKQGHDGIDAEQSACPEADDESCQYQQ